MGTSGDSIWSVDIILPTCYQAITDGSDDDRLQYWKDVRDIMAKKKKPDNTKDTVRTPMYVIYPR